MDEREDSRREEKRREKEKEAELAVSAPNSNSDEAIPMAAAIDENDLKLDATVAPTDIEDQPGAARRQGRGQARNYERGENDDGEATPESPSLNGRKYKIIAFFAVLIAAGVTAYFVLSKDKSGAQPETVPVTPLFDVCLAIANGDDLPNQEDLARQEYDILMDVELGSDLLDLNLVEYVLRTNIQKLLLPTLAGCTDQERRRLQIEDLIMNA